MAASTISTPRGRRRSRLRSASTTCSRHSPRRSRCPARFSSIGHSASEVAQTRTSAILDYGSQVRCTLSINHNHDFGRRNQMAEFRFDGTEGAAHVKLGVPLDYLWGEPDDLWVRARGEAHWTQVVLAGTTFP